MIRAGRHGGLPQGRGLWGPGILFGLGVALAGHALVSPAMEDRLSRELERGTRLYDRGEHTRGFIHFRKAMALDGANARARGGAKKYELFRRARRMDLETMKQELEKTVPDYRNDPHSLLLLARAARGDSDYETRIGYTRKALELNEHYSEAWYHLGHIKRRMGDYEEAIRHLERAIDLSPGVLRYRRRLVVISLESSDDGKAGEVLNRLIDRLRDLEQYIEMSIRMVRSGQMEESLFTQKTLVARLDSLADLEASDATWCISGAVGRVCMTDADEKTAFVYKHYLLSSYMASPGEALTELERVIGEQSGGLSYDRGRMRELLTGLADRYAEAGNGDEKEIKAALERVLGTLKGNGPARGGDSDRH